MMRRFLLVFFLVAAATAFAQLGSKVLVATGKEAIGAVPSPGTLFCEGGRPTGDPQGPPCSPGSKRIFLWNRNSVIENLEVTGSAAAMFRGKVNVVAHCNLDENYYGHCWGTYELTIPELGGRWEGIWSGPHDMITNTVSYSAIGYGYGGKLEGLVMRQEAAYPGGAPQGTFIVRVSSK